MAPKHLRQISENRQAIAPYNFVELPDQVVELTEDYLPKSNCYDPKRHTGKIDCTLTTSSPLYIRCGLTTEEFKDGKEAKDLPDFFYTNPTAKTQKTSSEKSSLQIILQLAKDNGGSVSVADCVIATGISVGEVKKTLGMLCAQEVMAIDNHYETGSIIYRIV